MKKNLILPLIILALGLTSCGGETSSKEEDTSNDESSSLTDETTNSSTIPDTFDGDGYVYSLPEKADDGVILQAFNWTFKQIKDELPYFAESGFKMIQTSPIQQPKSGGSSWWAFYQPLSFSIADNSPLGSKDDLRDLCEEADKYGIKIICDIVFNHLANISDSYLESDGTPMVSPDVERYEPEIYALRNDKEGNNTFHHNKNAKGSGAVTQYYAYGALPDLNTGNSLVQQRSLALLKEAIDVGVDGFRFDAAKHIETPDDPDYPSDFWPNVLGEAKTYYNEKTGEDLFAYGEILGGPDGGRDISYYTKYMKVSENTFIGNIQSGVLGKNADKMLQASYGKGNIPSSLVPWVESHDTYVEDDSHSSNAKIARMWAAVATRKDTNPMYLARPDSANTVGVADDIYCEEQTIGVINRFHNRFVGAEENIFVTDLQKIKNQDVNTAWVIERYSNEDEGAVIVLANLQTSLTVTFENLEDGTYFEEMTGQKVVISNKTAELSNLDESGIVCLTHTKVGPHPFIEVSERSGTFVGTKSITLTPKYCSSAAYSINGGEKIAISGKTTVTIGTNVDSENYVNLELSAENGEFTFERSYKYQKATLIDGYFNVLNFNPSYYDNFEIYLWTWGGTGSAQWYKAEYTVQNDVMLLDFTGVNYSSFLIGLFEKGYEIPDVTVWDTACLKQTKDISISTGYYDASAL